jgi:hypothetical protein
MNIAIMINARWVDGENPEKTRYRHKGIKVRTPAIFRALADISNPGNNDKT